MNNASLELGGTNWAEKDGNILGYSVGDTSGKYSPQEFTFARGSNLSATRIDRAGLIVKGRENVILQSNSLDNATWEKRNISVTGNQSGYDGLNNAWEILPNTSSGAHYIFQFNSNSSGITTTSIYAKANGYTHFYMYLNTNTTDRAAWFNLDTGSVGTQANTLIDATITDVGNDWYRCDVKQDIAITSVELYLGGNGENINFTGDGISSILFQDAQLELGLAASPYIPTTTTTAQAGVLENTPRLNYTTGVANPYLLLEPSRTNLIAQSEYFGDSYWTKIGASVVGGYSSPEGLSNAYKLVEDTSTGTHRVDSIEWIFITGGTTVTQSVYVKANGRTIVGLQDNALGAGHAVFNLSTVTVLTVYGVSAKIETLPNGWFRISYTFVSGGSGSMPYKTGIYALDTYTSGTPLSNTYTGDGTSGLYIYGAQLEIGSYPTSYIPTYSVSATRAQDVCNKADASGEIGQTEGTLFVDIKDLVWTSSAQRLIAISDGTSSNRIILINGQSSNTLRVLISTGNVLQTSTTAASSFGNVKVALAYSSSGGVVFVNGSQVLSFGAVSVPACSALYLGTEENGSGGSQPNGDYKQALIYKERLTNAELATLTTI